MSTQSWLLCALGVAVFGLASQAAENVPPAKTENAPAANGAVAMAGTFTRGKAGKRTDLKAAFTPKANNEYDVVFTCRWGNKDCTFKGSAQGSLNDGKVSGKATLSGSKRTWKFEGTAQNGELACKHWELKGANEELTGEFTVRKQG